MPPFDQSRDLRSTVATGATQVAKQHASFTLVPIGVVKALEYTADVGIPLYVMPWAVNTISALALRNCSICSIVQSFVSFILITIRR